MSFPHPFQSFYREQAALKFFVIFCLAITCLIVILACDQMVHSDEASGYSSLEFAGSNSQAISVRHCHLSDVIDTLVCFVHIARWCRLGRHARSRSPLSAPDSTLSL